MDFYYGIEHEIAFLYQQQHFADFSNTPFEHFAHIIEQLPVYESDYPQLRVGDAGIKYKRWYIEGYERFNDQREVISCAPKGIEIRTTIHNSIAGVMAELNESFAALVPLAARYEYVPVLTSFNPNFDHFSPQPPLTPFELARREASPEKITADIPMITYGPDLSLSSTDMSAIEVIDNARKLTYYSPYIIPFSFSSPFYQNTLWKGLSVRTYKRTGARPAAMAFLDDPTLMIDSNPSLTQQARVAAENGRIEFKAFDSCADFNLYASLLALLKGMIIDTSLTGRATVPNAALHQQAALHGFHNTEIAHMTQHILQAAYHALTDKDEQQLLTPLFTMLEQRKTPADDMRALYMEGMSINDVMLHYQTISH